MAPNKLACICISTFAALLWAQLAVAETPLDLSGYRADCEVRVEAWNGHMRAAWPVGNGETAEVTLDLSGERPLIEQMAIKKQGGAEVAILGGVDPIFFLTVGERRAADEK